MYPSFRRSFRRALRALLPLTLALAGAQAQADPSPALDRVSFLLGGYHADTNLTLEARDRDSSTGDFGLVHGRNTIARARLDVLAWDSQGFTFDYYRFSHSSRHHLVQPFEFDGVPFVVDTTARTRIDASTASAAYRWWFGHGNDVAGFGLGATWLRAEFGVSGTISIDEFGFHTTGHARVTEEAVAPLLTVGFRHAFSDRLRVYLDGSGVYKASGPLTGHIYDARLGVEWFPWQHVGIGAEYGTTQIHLRRHRAPYSAAVDLDLYGPSLFARLRF